MIIETKRLILRPFTKNDAADLLEYLKEPEPHCFECMKINSIEEAKDEAIKRSKDQELYFAVVLKDNNKVIGEIDASVESADPEQLDSKMDTYSPCWMINKKYRNNGYGYEMVYAFIDYLFKIRKARRIYIYTEDTNTACQHLCEKLGMRQEGLFKEFVSFVNDENGNPIYENTYQYAILDKEWNK